MKILHLCSYYIGAKVYKNLFEALASREEISRQNVFVPIRDMAQVGSNKSEKSGIELCYIRCLSWTTRVSFLIKVLTLRCVFKRYQFRSKALELCDVVHAHTLYSDGYLAYLINRVYGIPYVITVRTTDVSLFEKYLPHWRLLTKEVIRNAKCLIFLSHAHRKKIEETYKGSLPKITFIPNGIDQYWIRHALLRKKSSGRSGKSAIYIGEITLNKNIESAIQAFFAGQPVGEGRFTVLGGTYQAYRRVYADLPCELLSRTIFLERTENKDLIRECLRDSDVLIMPSRMETFGLVYLEAVSQCTPVVYSKGQGIDGLYPEGYIGYSCDPDDPMSVAAAVQQAIEAFPRGIDFTARAINPVIDFSWAGTASKLLDEVY
ncbi:glycosyltransferase family 4 protein [Ectopseudomonas mendocina]|uniref:glycosyltransferase family 4 protein n=1 Tax=Ectopseudomonas mendocina TaxID=300 RepID=UPI0009BE6E86|nr:glycosyltransferase family 4 protein [Pseudomonas mendocina]